MAGGSRFGAGRPAYRPCEAHYRSVDIRRFHREGMLARPGRWGWQWTRDGDQVASISLVISTDTILFDYRQRDSGNDWRDIKVTARLERTPCHFGGERVWFACPRCWRRCTRLFMVTGGMGCRKCFRMVYQSQREDGIGRSWRRTAKLEKALGIDGGPRRRMYRRTRDRLIDALCREEDRRDMLVSYGIARLFANAGMPVPDDL